MWEWLKTNYNQISAITQVIMAFSTLLGLASWPKFRDFIKNFITSILNWIREKIIGKENLELLKELKILKGNKRAIEFLSDFNKEDEYSKVNGGYEALWIFTCLYSMEMDFSEFKKAYEDDKKQGNNNKINELRIETFKKLIKKYSK
jgi:hypothetical protein